MACSSQLAAKFAKSWSKQHHFTHTETHRYIRYMTVWRSLQVLKLSQALGISDSIRRSTPIPWYIVHHHTRILTKTQAPHETISDVAAAGTPHPRNQRRIRLSRCTRCCTRCSRRPPSWTCWCWTRSCRRSRSPSQSWTSCSALASPPRSGRPATRPLPEHEQSAETGTEGETIHSW